MNILETLTLQEKKLVKYLHVNQNQIVLHEGDICNAVYILIKGNIEIISYNIDGNEETISLLNKGDLFANALIFSKKNKLLGEVIATQPTDLAYIEKKDLIYLLQNNLDFLIYYLNLISEKTITATLKAKLLGHKSVRSRIIYYFEIHDNKVFKNISRIAKDLILPRPSVSREIHKMLSENLICLNNNYLILK